MWNPYEVEKNYEQHMKEMEKRARYAHWYTKPPGRRAWIGIAAGTAVLAVVLALLGTGYFFAA